MLGIILLAGAWGFLAACAANGLVGVFSSAEMRSGKIQLAVTSYVLLICVSLGLALSLAAQARPSSVLLGLVFGFLCGCCSIEWCIAYSMKNPWDMTFHASCSLLVSGVLVMFGFLLETAVDSLCYTILLLLVSGLLIVAVLSSNQGQTAQGVADISVSEALRDFLRSQWVPLLGIFFVTFAYGLRWQSAVTGLTIDKFYDFADWPLLLGSIIVTFLVLVVALQTEEAYPQRSLCLTLLPVATAIMLVVPIMNPASGFYDGIDFDNAVGAMLEFMLDVLSETAVSTFVLVTFLSAIDASRTSGLAGTLAAAVYLGIAAAGVLLGVYGCMAIGRNGRVLCVIIWAVYLLLLFFRSLTGKNESETSLDASSHVLFGNLLHEVASSLTAQYGLSKREEEILFYLARGYSNTYIAQNLCITESTVRTHVHHIYEKMGVGSREELFALIDEQNMDLAAACEKGSARQDDKS